MCPSGKAVFGGCRRPLRCVVVVSHCARSVPRLLHRMTSTVRLARHVRWHSASAPRVRKPLLCPLSYGGATRLYPGGHLQKGDAIHRYLLDLWVLAGDAVPCRCQGPLGEFRSGEGGLCDVMERGEQRVRLGVRMGTCGGPGWHRCGCRVRRTCLASTCGGHPARRRRAGASCARCSRNDSRSPRNLLRRGVHGLFAHRRRGGHRRSLGDLPVATDR